MEGKKIAVVGAGNMGHAIARTSAVFGFEVVLMDENADALEAGILTIQDEIKKYFVGRGKMNDMEASVVLKRLRGTVKIEEAVTDTDLVIEAIFEDLNLKKRVFAELDRVCQPHTILASNTSYLSITGIAEATKVPDRVIGMHFFNPPDVNILVEVAPGLLTSEETVARAMHILKIMGKVPMRVKDTPGFVVNRFINKIYSEAATLVMNGIATAEDIDTAVKLALGFRLGPCEMMDYSGLDIIVQSMGKDLEAKGIYLIQKMVDAGRYGRKNGKGFYDYSPNVSKKLADLSNVVGKIISK